MRGIMWLFPQSWVIVGTLSLIIAGNYRLRTRDVGQATSGNIDGTIIFEVVVYMLVFLGTYFSLELQKYSHFPRPFVWASVYVGLLVISSFYTPYFLYGIVRSFEALTITLFAYLVMLQSKKNSLSFLVHAFLVLVVFSVLCGFLVNTTATSGTQAGRFTWLALHPTVSSVFLALGVIMAFTCCIQEKMRIWNIIFYPLMCLLFISALVMNQTRGSALAVFIGILVVSYLSFSRSTRTNIILWGSVTGSMGVFILWNNITAFLTRGASVENLETLNNRTLLWKIAWDAVERKPWFGYGIGSSKGIFFETTGLGGGHNMIINVLVEVGFVGLFAWLVFVMLAARRIISLLRNKHDDSVMMTGIFIIIMISGLFYDGPGMAGSVSFIWLFVILALSYGPRYFEQKRTLSRHTEKKSFKTLQNANNSPYFHTYQKTHRRQR